MQFMLETDFVQLDKLLKVCGLVATGGEAKMAIQDGAVTVDGQVETRRGRKVGPGMRVEFAGQSVDVLGKV